MPTHSHANDSAWQSGKDRHLQLSESVADRYDEVYEEANFATGSYMRYEVGIVRWASEQAPDRDIAIDLGCGTGRDTFELSKKFRQVFAYDFSPRMVKNAQRNKFSQLAGNVSFSVADVELGIPDLPSESAALVNSAFGMGSFVSNIDTLFQIVRRVLKPHGVAVFSFYNARALVNQLDLEWKPALAARANAEADSLTVEFDDDVYHISARAYDFKELQYRLGKNFEILKLTTFPVLTSILPHGVLADKNAQRLCTLVDDFLAGQEDVPFGPYIVAVVRRPSHGRRVEGERRGYDRVLELFRTHRLEPNLLEHAPVRTMEEVRDTFPGVDPDIMVKSVLVMEALPDPDADPRSARAWLFGVPAAHKLDMGKVAKLLECRRSRLRMATALEVEQRTGFGIGSIPPFAMPKQIPVVLDQRLARLEEVWCGTGKSTESLRISAKDLRKLSTFTEADISSPRCRPSTPEQFSD